MRLPHCFAFRNESAIKKFTPPINKRGEGSYIHMHSCYGTNTTLIDSSPFSANSIPFLNSVSGNS